MQAAQILTTLEMACLRFQSLMFKNFPLGWISGSRKDENYRIRKSPIFSDRILSSSYYGMTLSILHINCTCKLGAKMFEQNIFGAITVVLLWRAHTGVARHGVWGSYFTQRFYYFFCLRFILEKEAINENFAKSAVSLRWWHVACMELVKIETCSMEWFDITTKYMNVAIIPLF